MANIASVSESELGQRRRQLRRTRTLKVLQLCWQTVAVTGIAGGLIWMTTRPSWVIYQPEQVDIKGNKFLSTQTIRTMLPINYPQSLFRVQPQNMAQKLETTAPIAKATVTRHLFPPGLTVQIKERYPVALTQAIASNSPTQQPRSNMGVLDENGWWTPLQNYTSLDQTLQLPSLKVIGNPDQYRNEWPGLYRTLSNSPVKVFEIDWQDPANIIFKTEIGIVHIGPYSVKLIDQLKAIDRMRHFPKHPRYKQIAYIDLKNPVSPTLKMLNANGTAQPKTQEKSVSEQ